MYVHGPAVQAKQRFFGQCSERVMMCGDERSEHRGSTQTGKTDPPLSAVQDGLRFFDATNQAYLPHLHELRKDGCAKPRIM